MFTKRDVADINQTDFFESEMTSGAAVRDLLLRQPDLLDSRLEMTFKGYSIGASTNEVQVLLLISMPLVEVILCRGDGEQHQQNQAG